MAVRGKNVAAFKADLQKFADLIKQDVRTVRRKVVLDLHDRITRRTPVDTGRLRASWNVSDGQPDNAVPPVGPNSGTGNVTASFTDPFGVTYISTALPYAPAIEFEGHSKQAPAGMMRVSIAEVEAEIESTIERLR